MHGVAFPDCRRLVWDTSQTKTAGSEDRIPIMPPKGVYWICHRGRPLLGQEAMSCQALWLPAACQHRFDGSLLQNLAGNAFNAFSCTEATILQFIILGFIHRCRRSSGVIPMLPPMSATSPSCVLASIESIECKRDSDVVKLSEFCGVSGSDSDDEFDLRLFQGGET